MKTLKKALTLTLALVIVLALAVPASAGGQAVVVSEWADAICNELSPKLEYVGYSEGGYDQPVFEFFLAPVNYERGGGDMTVNRPQYGTMLSYNGERIPVFSVNSENPDGSPNFYVLMDAYGTYQFRSYSAANVNGVLTNITADDTWTFTSAETAGGDMYFWYNVGDESDEVIIIETYKNGSKMQTVGITYAGAANLGITATPSSDKLTVDGEVQNPTVYNIGGNNYFKVRDLAAMLNGTDKQIDVGYDNVRKAVSITTGESYAKQSTDLTGPAASSQTATVSNDSVQIDGRWADLTVYKINGNNYFKLRDLGKALDFYVGWSQADGVTIDTTMPYAE